MAPKTDAVDLAPKAELRVDTGVEVSVVELPNIELLVEDS